MDEEKFRTCFGNLLAHYRLPGETARKLLDRILEILSGSGESRENNT